MRSEPTVSVIMPAFNAARHVAEAAESILGQTLADLELIIVDDGSADGTREVLQRYAAHDPRVRLILQDRNRGVVASRNRALECARAEYVALMDADDVSRPSRLNDQLSFLQKHDDVAVGSAVEVIDDDGRPSRLATFPEEPGVVAWSMLFFNSVAHPTLLARRAAVEACGGYAEGYPGAEDYALLVRLSTSGRVSNMPEPLLLYRRWPGSVSVRSAQQQDESAGRVVTDWLMEKWGVHLRLSEALALQGLSRRRYPRSRDEIASIGAVVSRLAPLFSGLKVLTVGDRRSIRTHAGVRLLMLAALALRAGEVQLCRRLTGQAVALSPASLMEFARKSLGRFGATN